jgi:hypothetical protein
MFYHVVPVHLRVRVPNSSLGHLIIDKSSKTVVSPETIGIGVHGICVPGQTTDSWLDDEKRSMKRNDLLFEALLLHPVVLFGIQCVFRRHL